MCGRDWAPRAALKCQTDGEEGSLKVEQEEEGVMKALKSTLCFDKGSSLVMDGELFIFWVSVQSVVPPNRRDAAVRHHPAPPQAEAAAGLQQGQLDERAGAQLQHQKDAREGRDDGHAA